MIVSLVDERLIWFLFPGRKHVTPRGSLLEGGKVVCVTKTRQEAEAADRMLSLAAEDHVVVCPDTGNWDDASTWPLVFKYMVERRGFQPLVKVAKFFDVRGDVDEETKDFLLRFVGEAVASKKWPVYLLNSRRKAYVMCEHVAYRNETDAIEEWFAADDPDMSLAMLCKLAMRALGKEYRGSEWSFGLAEQAKKVCDFSPKTRSILTERRFPKRFCSLAFMLGVLGKLR